MLVKLTLIKARYNEQNAREETWGIDKEREILREGRLERRQQEVSELSVTGGLISGVLGGFLTARRGPGGLLSLHGHVGFRGGRRSRGTGCKPTRGTCSGRRSRSLLVLPSTSIVGILRHGLISGARLRVVIISASGGIPRLGMLRWRITPL